MKIAFALIVSLVLVGCAGEVRRPAGPPRASVTADEVKELLRDYRLDFKDVHADAIGMGKLDPKHSDRELWVELPAGAVFEAGNAALQVGALKPLGDVAQSIAARGACVVQIVAYAADDAAADLADRRAASLVDNFARQSISPSRLRGEARIDPSRADRVAIALRPVVIGRENEAWMPASLGE